MNKPYLHTTLAVVIIFFLLVVADLVPFWMPMMGELVAVMIVSVGLVFWAGVILQEQAKDEREVALKMKSGRIAYLSGLAILLIALIVQGLAHDVDPWIAVSLGVMVAVKLVTRIYLE
jgi:hypothetical protein